MDLEWLRANPHLVAMSLEHQRIRVTPVVGGDICTAERLTLDDGSDLFAKRFPGTPPEGFFEAEAAGLGWLAVPGGPALPEVLAVDSRAIVLEWIHHGAPTASAAAEFGRRLAVMHRAPCAGFGADWPGYIGNEPLDNTVLRDEPWLDWYRRYRIEPYLRRSRDADAITTSDVAQVESALKRSEILPEPPARIHGDLHPGNVLWGRDHAWLIDPAAHGGHRETDLATLHLFGGTPHLDHILAAYQEIHPLSDGWQERLGLHQLHLALVHTTMFGPAYANLVRAAAGR